MRFMPPGNVAGGPVRDVSAMELFALCAEDTNNASAWSDFLARYASKIRFFIISSLRHASSSPHPGSGRDAASSGMEVTDLFQSTILRLVQNDCAAMKRFSGKCDDDLLAYLAVIAQSVVRDALRRQRSLKRPKADARIDSDSLTDSDISGHSQASRHPPAEWHTLAQEVRRLSLEEIKKTSGRNYLRDKLIFELYFFHGISVHGIARCAGIGLSKTGVENVLNRLKDSVRTRVADDLPGRV
jgi:RNA polymerase sigma factor (sigma-70 family)